MKTMSILSLFLTIALALAAKRGAPHKEWAADPLANRYNNWVKSRKNDFLNNSGSVLRLGPQVSVPSGEVEEPTVPRL